MVDDGVVKTAQASLDEGPEVLLESLPGRLEGVNFLAVAHGRYSGPNAHMIRAGHSDERLRPVVEFLANSGWFQYRATDTESFFVRHSSIRRIWPRVLSGDVQVTDDGLFYSVQSEPGWSDSRSLIVVFSSMSTTHDGPTLSRYFEQNFSSISKHVGGGLNVLRIADLDGVVGGFYSPTTFVPDRVDRVNRLIEQVVRETGVPNSRVILYGASKGGTASLLYGLTNSNGWRAISVDPVVDDKFYEEVYRDSHWTSGTIFLNRKTDLFQASVRKFNASSSVDFDSSTNGQIALVTGSS